jgi:hypothetical protein
VTQGRADPGRDAGGSRKVPDRRGGRHEDAPATGPAAVTEGPTLTTPVRRRALSLLAAAAVTAGPLAAAAPALAAPHHRPHAATCTITAAERTEATDTLAALTGRLHGHKPTDAEKRALRSAVAELRSAARQVRMTDAVRAAKKAEITRLLDSLDTATTPEQRTAIRAEVRAIRVELAAARPTAAERKALQRAIRELQQALRAKPTHADKRQLLSQIKAVKARLACTTPSTSTTTPPPAAG